MDRAMDEIGHGQETAGEVAAAAVLFDGTSSRRRQVSLTFDHQLEINEAGKQLGSWNYADMRRADGPAGMLRLSCVAAPALARLEIRDAATAARLVARCTRLDENVPGRRGVAAIVGWSLAAVVSLVMVILFGVPLAADRLAPLLPDSWERRLGEVADGQMRQLFGREICGGEASAGQAAFAKLVDAVRGAAEIDFPIESAVLRSGIPNAFALPGGKVYLLSGLLMRAKNPDEIAGVLAHELGHLKHRDSTRVLIYNGGTSFLIGLLFGDITGSGALIFASQSMVTASHSRQAEEGADAFSIDVMRRLGRPTKAMGELLIRVTGTEAGKGLSILSSHPITEDRLARMSREDRPVSGPPLLTATEWRSLKSICDRGRY